MPRTTHAGPPAECFICKQTFADPVSLIAHRPKVGGACLTPDEMSRTPGWRMSLGHWRRHVSIEVRRARGRA